MRLSAFFALLALSMAAGGCRSFLHFSDPSADDFVERMCIGKADEHRAEIEAEAQRTGTPIETLLLAFQTACLFRAKAGVSDADRAGMAGVMGHAPLTPENAAPDLKDPALEGRK